jgi:acyl carrier protein
MKKTLIQLINEVLEQSGKSPIQSYILTDDLRADLGMDSVDLALLTVLIEDEYGIDIFETGLISKISDIREKLNG